MNNTDIDKLRAVKNFEDLVEYLSLELEKPIDTELWDTLDTVACVYNADELGIDPQSMPPPSSPSARCTR